MRISLFKTIYIFAFSSSAILAVLVLSILWSYQKIELAYEQDNYAKQVHIQANSLRLLMLNDNIYASQYDDSYWQFSQNKLSKLLSKAPKLPPKLQTIQNSINSQNDSINRLFKHTNKNKLQLTNNAIKRHLRLKLMTLIDIMSTDAKQLSAIAQQHINDEVKHQLIFVLAVLLISIVCLSLGACKLIGIFKKSLAEIKKAFQANYSGDFEEIVLSEHYQEFDAIALEFNKMLNKLHEVTASLEKLSNSDPLTSVANRRYLFERGELGLARAKRNNSKLTVVLLDCDYFKKINDNYGHLFGDEVLKMICAIGKKIIRDVDCIARYGGEEFVILLPDCDFAGGIELGKRLQQALSLEHLCYEGDNVHITISIGVCTLATKHARFEQLISCADQAMYLAKKNGRNRIETSA